ncbi:MAG: HNH endonuclease family protein [Ilumatobacteraceae bacterium]
MRRIIGEQSNFERLSQTTKQLTLAAGLVMISAVAGSMVSTARTGAAPVAAADRSDPTASATTGIDPIGAELTGPAVANTSPSTPATPAVMESGGSDASDSSAVDPLDDIGLAADDILGSIPVELEHRGGYDRDLFAIWLDQDGDGCDTRTEVLIEESLIRLPDAPRCGLLTGRWFSEYDDVTVDQASDLDVDHVVSLKEAWDSGAWAWTPERRIAYGNDLTDPRTLLGVTASSNREKGDRDPSNWIPENDHLCAFVADWIAVKARWSLSMDESEHGRLRNLIADRCPDLVIMPWNSPP